MICPDEQTDRRTDRQTDRQTDRRTHMTRYDTDLNVSTCRTSAGVSLHVRGPELGPQ